MENRCETFNISEYPRFLFFFFLAYRRWTEIQTPREKKHGEKTTIFNPWKSRETKRESFVMEMFNAKLLLLIVVKLIKLSYQLLL